MALEQKKIILKNKPTNGANGQYNYGTTTGGADYILGIDSSGIFSDNETELYTLVSNGKQNPFKSGGEMWLSQGSKIEIISCNIDSRQIDTDDPGKPNYYRDARVAMYFFDDAVTPEIKNASSGNQLRDLIGEGNSFGGSPHMFAYWNKGKSEENKDLGDVVQTGAWGDGKLEIRDFPKEANTPFSDFKGGQVVDTNMVKFTKSVLGANDSSYYIVIRTSGDEREYAPLGHGWLGLSGGYEIDERNRGYVVAKIPKKDLYDKWKNFSGESWDITFSYGTNQGDDYGNARGHRFLNNTPHCYDVTSLTIRITAPLWSLAKAENNNDSVWVNPDIQPITLLNPTNNIDYIGCDSSFYPGNSYPYSYFKTSLLDNGDFRPISQISESSSGNNYDMQNYYNKEFDPTLYSSVSAPNTVTLKFDIADNNANFNINYKSYNPTTDLVKYGFFVDNWDWKQGDAETLDEITDNFPFTASEIEYRKQIGEYDFKRIGVSPFTEGVSHVYNSPGVKVIKAVVLSFIENHWTDTSNGSQPFLGYIQSLDWRIVTMRINLTTDSLLTSDFNEVGGSSFSYLPYPDSFTYCSDFSSTIDNCNSKIIKSPHPIISGLSRDSSYVKALKGIIKTNKFSDLEGFEKSRAIEAYENTPNKEVDEYGNYMGQSDISQVRYFRTGSMDLPSLLGIQTGVTNVSYDFHPHSDSGHWDGKINSFPIESSVGDIFIDGYSGLKNICNIELNLSEISNTTIKDSSGNGNIGIMFGDYSIKKTKKDKPTVKNSYFKLPKIGKNKGAF